MDSNAHKAPEKTPEKEKARGLATIITVTCQVLRTLFTGWRFFNGDS